MQHIPLSDVEIAVLRRLLWTGTRISDQETIRRELTRDMRNPLDPPLSPQVTANIASVCVGIIRKLGDPKVGALLHETDNSTVELIQKLPCHRGKRAP